MRLDTLRVVAWVFIVSGSIAAVDMIQAAWTGAPQFSVSIFGLWIGLDLLELRPRARVWGVRLLVLELLANAIWIGGLVFMTTLTPSVLSLPMARPVAIIYASLWFAARLWQLSTLSAAATRARFNEEPSPSSTAGLRGARAVAALTLCAGLVAFGRSTTWKLSGRVDGVVTGALHSAEVVVQSADGRTVRSPVSDSGAFSLELWRHPTGPFHFAVCDAGSHSPVHFTSIGYHSTGRDFSMTSPADPTALCGA